MSDLEGHRVSQLKVAWGGEGLEEAQKVETVPRAPESTLQALESAFGNKDMYLDSPASPPYSAPTVAEALAPAYEEETHPGYTRCHERDEVESQAEARRAIPRRANLELGTNHTVLFSYYPFVAISHNSQVSPQEFNFLQQQGCLSLPTRAMLDEFMHQYFLRVHPLLPLLDEGEFWDAYSMRGAEARPTSAIPLLFIQAMVFVACNVSRVRPGISFVAEMTSLFPGTLSGPWASPVSERRKQPYIEEQR